jgi:hypothetical protein
LRKNFFPKPREILNPIESAYPLHYKWDIFMRCEESMECMFT